MSYGSAAAYEPEISDCSHYKLSWPTFSHQVCLICGEVVSQPG